MPSTVIRRFDYRAQQHELVVEFTTGRRYLYRNVPEDVASAFRNAFAKGVFFNRNIRDRFEATELDSDAE